MKTKLRIVMAQLNLNVGDIDGNLQKHKQAIATARDQMQADLIVFPELSITGYPPEDLLQRKSFIADADKAVQSLIAQTKGIYCLVGYPYFKSGRLRNGCVLFFNDAILATYAKERLPNYAVFDEARYFAPGKKPAVATIAGFPIGIVICEDLWSPSPVKKSVDKGAKLIVAINASPFVGNKHERRRKMLAQRAIETDVPILYVCNVGGQDDLVFDGDSMAIDNKGELCTSAGMFIENLQLVEVEIRNKKAILTANISQSPDTISHEEKIYQACVLAIRDYVEKNHIPGVLIGVSGGIDSALTLAMAVDAIGKERVRAVILPSRFTSELSMQEAKAITQNLNVQTDVISIEPAYRSLLETLAKNFAGTKTDITEENLQARCRAVILMALANKTAYIVFSTGNRSELAVGYCTIYGDMVGGFAPLKDVYKTMVYRLANYRNQISRLIPQPTIDRAPSAELAADQKDQDTLPPYSTLDAILKCYLDSEQSIDEIVAQGFERETVTKVVNMIHKSEYKRRQGAIGPRVQRNSFGKGWRYPLTNGYKG